MVVDSTHYDYVIKIILNHDCFDDQFMIKFNKKFEKKFFFKRNQIPDVKYSS